MTTEGKVVTDKKKAERKLLVTFLCVCMCVGITSVAVVITDYSALGNRRVLQPRLKERL